ncbi:hypothetical protein [Frigoriglobus tundricola]|uniref:hypothetical protein n=1 Tax=Frigoriglobus tundricola TaxID=2774151 RepID=UPI00148EA8EF|nr:hypothetical protein [Frigoriglobus tundricola]
MQTLYDGDGHDTAAITDYSQSVAPAGGALVVTGVTFNSGTSVPGTTTKPGTFALEFVTGITAASKGATPGVTSVGTSTNNISPGG